MPERNAESVGSAAASAVGSKAEALVHAALAVSRAAGPAMFADLVGDLAATLRTDAAFVAVFTDQTWERMSTLAAVLDGRPLANYTFVVATSPCAGVVGRDFRYVAQGVSSEFRPGSLYLAEGMDSYAAHTMTDRAGRMIGLVAALKRQPIGEPKLAEALLKIYAVRIAAEIERTRAEEALRASEANYRSMFEAADDPVLVHDWDTGEIVDVNPAACSVIGYDREALRRISIAGISSGVPPYTGEEAHRRLAQAKLGEAVRFEWQRRNRDGTLHWDEVRLKPAVIGGERRILASLRDITQRKLAEQALKASEERYRLLFEMESDAILLVDAETLQLVDMNPMAEGLWGYSRAELLAMKATDLSAEPEETRAAVQEPSGPIVIPVRWHRRKDGTVFPIEITANRFILDGRKIVLAAIRDITERMKAEEAVRASEEQYRAIFEASADALVLWDQDLRRVDVNPAFERIFGWSRAEALAGANGPYVPEDYARRRRELLQRTLAAGEPGHAELQTLRKDGSRAVVEVRTIPFQHRGAPHVLAISTDVTERRAAEERVRESEERHRLLFEMESDAIVLVDIETMQHIDVNRAAAELYGYSRDELLQLTSADLSAESGETRAAMQAGARHAKGFVRVPLRYHRKKDGTVFPVEITANFFDLRGRRIMLAAIRDITERKQAQEALEQARSALFQSQKMEAIGQLTGGIAHDFNNILTSVLGYIALATERTGKYDDAHLVRQLGEATRAAQRARDLIAKMLAFSRRQHADRRPHALGPVVRQAIALLRPMLPATIELQVDLPESAPAAVVDAVQLEQVLLNLCINARDAMEGSGRIGIAIRETELRNDVCASCRMPVDGRWVELVVSDSGIGIPGVVMERMFDPFYTTKEVGQGTGMGLAMVHGIVHDHGGHVIVESRPGIGTTFRICLPAAPADAAPEPALPPRRIASSRPEMRGRVLLVEDEPMVARFMTELLESWGLEVTLHGHPADAHAWFVHRPQYVDVVITDQMMPAMTGLELAAAITSLRPDLPVFVYTGYGEEIDEGALHRAGAVALLKKPIESAVLRRHLEAVLGTSSRARC
jgi:PAS domain S-box-containing protein